MVRGRIHARQAPFSANRCDASLDTASGFLMIWIGARLAYRKLGTPGGPDSRRLGGHSMAVRPRNRRSGVGKSGAIVVLVLVAVLAGLVYGFWDDIRARFAGPEPEEPVLIEPVEVARVAPEPPKPLPAVEPKLEPLRRAEPKPVDKAALARRRRAQQARLQADAALKALDFKLAARLYKTTAVYLEGTEEAGAFNALSEKAFTFAMLTENVKLNPEAEGDLVILHLEMSDLECVLVDETPDEYIVERKNGIRAPIPKEDVRSIERVGRGDYRKRALAGIEKAKREMKERSGVAYYLLAERAYKEGLAEKTIEYLDLAYALDGDDLPAHLRRYEAGQLLYRAHWSESTGRASTARMWCQKLERLYPDVTGLVEEARELRERIAEREAGERGGRDHKPTVKISVRKKSSSAQAEEEVTGVRIDEVRSTSTRHAKTIDKINRLFKEAMGHYVAGRPGNPNSNRHLAQAAKGFNQVSALCDKVLRDEPSNSAVERRQQDATRFRYHAMKMKTLSLGR